MAIGAIRKQRLPSCTSRSDSVSQATTVKTAGGWNYVQVGKHVRAWKVIEVTNLKPTKATEFSGTLTFGRYLYKITNLPWSFVQGKSHVSASAMSREAIAANAFVKEGKELQAQFFLNNATAPSLLFSVLIDGIIE